MDKKNNYRSNPTCSAKGVVSESRKNQDATGGKQWPRNGRRRESTNFSANSKPEPTRPKQSTLRQATNFDKRFRARGDGYQRSAGPTTTSLSPGTGLDDDAHVFEAELNSVYIPGSKKQNLNHLLNFNYAPRDHNDAMTFSSFRSPANGHYRSNHHMKKTKYNKEQFLQATCQFVVNDNFDYDAYTVCPDTLVDWNNVEQVIVQTAAEEPQCPICLFPPVAGKMTRCGHIYCWPCLLQYLSLSDKSWRKCPICYDAVHSEHLKSVISKPYPIYNVDDTVTMQLMCREKNSLMVSKVTDSQRKRRCSTNIPHLLDDAEELQHTKLILADSNEIKTIIDRENNELIQQLMADGFDCPESIFIRQALELLSERDTLLKSTTTKIQQKIKTKEANHTPSSPAAADIDGTLEKLKLNIEAKPFIPNNHPKKIDVVDANDGDENNETAAATAAVAENNFIIDEETNLTLHDIDIESMAIDSNLFYFYQAADGQHLYLKSINVRMLQMQYGSLDKAPRTICGKILQKESCSMTEDLRKRLKYLQHLPVTSQFDVVEIALDIPIVSAEVLAKFKDELIHRQKQRQRRAREERQREKHINEVNDRQIGKILSRSANIDMTSNRHFPMCGGSYDSSPPTFQNSFDDHPPLVGQPTTFNENGSNSSFASGTSIIANAASSSATLSQPAVAGPSFARMLTTAGQAKVELWPSLGPTKGFVIDPTNGVKGEKKSTDVSAKEMSENDDDGDDDDLARAPPEFKSSFGTAIAEALNKSASKSKQLSVNNFEMGTAKGMNNGCAGVGGKQKKKNKKTILFSTSARPF